MPLLLVVQLGRPEWTLYAAFGAFASLYGRNHVHLSRAVMQASAGAALVTAVSLGGLVGTLEDRAWLAVGAAGAIATAVGIGHPYWATVAAVAPLTVRGVSGQLLRAAHRVVGTLLGLVTAAALLALQLDPVPTILVVAVLQFVTEMLIGRNYGMALLFITPLALLMGQLAAHRPAGELLLDRGVETVIGAAVAAAIVLVEHRLRGRDRGVLSRR